MNDELETCFTQAQRHRNLFIDAVKILNVFGVRNIQTYCNETEFLLVPTQSYKFIFLPKKILKRFVYEELHDRQCNDYY